MHHHFALPILLASLLFPKFPWNFELFKMPSTENAVSDEPEECLELDDPEDYEEEEEVEYEEIEEEVEDDGDEDVVEEVEVEEEEEEEPEEIEVFHEYDATHDSDSKMQGDDRQDGAKDGNEKKKHAELLALPPHGSELHVGGVSSDASSEDIRKLCEPVGEVVEVRMMHGRGDSKGYAFVTFRTKDLALKAIRKLNNASLKGKKIRVSSSQAKNKIFIGNIPHSWTHDNLKKAVEEVGPGVLKIDLMKESGANRNRGYGFVEYYNHACAEYARQKMSAPKFKLGTNAPTVSWADAKNDESASTAQVKSVYVKNLPKDVTQSQLKKLFEHHGEITKVILPPSRAGHDNRYGFVHFKERAMAVSAVENAERYELDGQVLDCSIAKPPAADKKDDPKVSVPNARGGPLLSAPNARGGSLFPSYAPLGYGIIPTPSAYGGLPAGISQPLLYAPGAPPGATMAPMLLPDGRLVYVVQQPSGHQPQPQPQHQHHHFASPLPPQQGGRYGGSGSSHSSSAKRQRGDDHSRSRDNGRRRHY